VRLIGAVCHSLYVSFAYKHASLICTSPSRPKAVHISGVHCTSISDGHTRRFYLVRGTKAQCESAPLTAL